MSRKIGLYKLIKKRQRSSMDKQWKALMVRIWLRMRSSKIHKMLLKRFKEKTMRTKVIIQILNMKIFLTLKKVTLLVTS
jgi:hypothetical protein